MSPPEDVPTPDRRLASVDLGSNSFHLLVSNLVGGEPVVVDRIRDHVQLAAGLDKESRLRGKAMERGWECLRLFGQRLRDVPPAQVRAVATSTLRRARNGDEFLQRGEELLGHPIEVISGDEEARLIYLGVSHTMADDAGLRLVVDIGGGSTECILGEHFDALEVHSLQCGHVSLSKRLFPDGGITAAEFDKAVLVARLEMVTVERRFRDLGWLFAIGASGTVRAVESVLVGEGWSAQGIPKEGLRRLRQAMIERGHTRKLARFGGLKPERFGTFPAGVAILQALFDALGIEHMSVSSGALREGVLYDLLGRIRHEDVRERTIQAMQTRFQVDRAQAQRVQATVLAALAQVRGSWGLSQPGVERFLAWAAQLHEIGLVLSYGKHHRHGWYILSHAYLPGFSRDDQRLLAAIVGGHRRKIRALHTEGLSGPRLKLARRLTALLRLAVLLNRARSAGPPVPVRLTASKKSLRLAFAPGWLEQHPLTRLDLDEEARPLGDLGIELSVRDAGGEDD